jgi:threonylcarbamoyladenosine tRNA methylthiotransferase MtaB
VHPSDQLSTSVSSQKTVYLKTLGCKVNAFDAQVLQKQFVDQGFTLLDSPEGAQVTVINTCSVTQQAEKEALYLLRRYQRENPEGLRVVTGCYAQIASTALAARPEVDCVIPNEQKGQLVPIVLQHLSQGALPPAEGAGVAPEALPKNYATTDTHEQFKSSLVFFDRPQATQTRAFVKIQDGCNGFCSYCQIPYARGASRSVPLDQALTQIIALAESGVPEIVLTGIHIGDYGEDLAEAPTSLAALVEAVFERTSLARLRISSLEPGELSEALLEVLARYRDRVCDHFHLPLQSGDATILKRMRRTYTPEQYLDAVNRIRAVFPQAQMSADVIPGFPGETEAQFEATVAFIQQCGLHSLHVFPYSARPNTYALRLPDHLPPAVVAERAKVLRTLSDGLYEGFCRSQYPFVHTVLWENTVDAEGYRHGKTRNYLAVATQDQPGVLQAGMETQVQLKGFLRHQLLLASL